VQVASNSALGTAAVNMGANSTLQAGVDGLTIANIIDISNSDVAQIDTQAFTLTLGGNITSVSASGAPGLIKNGSGTLVLNGRSSYSSDTEIAAGILMAGAANAFSPTSLYQLDAGTTLALNGFNNTIGALQGSGNVALGAGTLSVGDSRATTYSGNILGSSGLTKTGGESLTLAGASSYTGPTIVAGGVLQASAANAFAPASAFRVKANTLLDLNGFDQTIGSLAGDGAVSVDPATLTTGGDNTSTTFNGTISGDGAVTKAGAGTMTLTGASTYTGPTLVAAGQLVVSGSITSSPVTVQSGALLGGGGTIGALLVQQGATVMPGVATPLTTLNVRGPVTFASGSAFTVSTNDTGQNDRVSATSAATIQGGTVNAIFGPGNYDPTTRYTLVSAAAGVTGAFSALSAQTDLPFLTPVLSYDANNVFLGFQRAQVAAPDGGTPEPVPLASAATTTNQTEVASALESTQPASSLAVRNAITPGEQLFNLVLGQTLEGARQAFTALSGEVYADLAVAAMQDSRLPREAILHRIADGLAQDGPQPAQLTGLGDIAFWVDGFGGWGSSSDNQFSPMSHTIGGFLAGADTSLTAWNQSFRLGIAGGYSGDNLDFDHMISSATTRNTYLALYGAVPLDIVNISGGFIFTQSSSDVYRTIAFPGLSNIASASLNGHSTQEFIELSHPWAPYDMLSLEPFGNVAVFDLQQGPLSEQGGIAALDGLSGDHDLTTTTLGLRASVSPFADTPIRGYVMLGWRHAFGTVQPGAALAFEGAPLSFQTVGAAIDRDAFASEVGVDCAITPDMGVGLSYSGQHGVKAAEDALQGHLNVRL
jgi:autotransporter-associated beta strand protein